MENDGHVGFKLAFQSFCGEKCVILFITIKTNELYYQESFKGFYKLQCLFANNMKTYS